jgi:DNA-directed RNA polymerase subunit beta'
LARPHDIRSWSFGEVKKPETINYRTYRPEKDGLFCERIFGPEKDWECACGKYRGMKYKGMICDRCGVKVTHSRVRRKRMGHIELAAPSSTSGSSRRCQAAWATLLDMKTSSLEKVIYFQDYVVIDPGDDRSRRTTTVDRRRVSAPLATSTARAFEADMGAEAVRKLLMNSIWSSCPKSCAKSWHETNSKQKKRI